MKERKKNRKKERKTKKEKCTNESKKEGKKEIKCILFKYIKEMHIRNEVYHHLTRNFLRRCLYVRVVLRVAPISSEAGRGLFNDIQNSDPLLLLNSFGGEIKPLVPYRIFATCKSSLMAWIGTPCWQSYRETFLAQCSTFRC